MLNKGEKTTSVLADFFLDITREVCPFTFVRTRLLLERMRPGQIAEVRLCGAEPLANVPRSASAQGHEVMSLEAEDPHGDAAGPHRLLIRKGPAREKVSDRNHLPRPDPDPERE